MEKVVTDAIKIDLHIHSCFSSGKDGDKVSFNTKENLNTLISGLIDNNVNVAAITDHDTFNYDLYQTLKEQEKNDNCIKKVLPGIEFSVEFITGTQIHIVTIFDDSDAQKVKNIETIMTSGIGMSKYSKTKKQYTRKDYIDILDEIGLNFVMIAHQKKTITSTNAKAKPNDVLSLGKEMFNELVFMDYFDAFEFRNKKNELYNKSFQISNNVEDNVRFITGSDCHNWKYYPYTEDGEIHNFNFTYLKSLPSFKGLAMAITDNHRIAYENNFFNPLEKYIPEITLTIGGVDRVIPLSKGLNVIIGDNSIGKSLFLHELTSNYKLKDKQVEKGYKKYLEKKGICFGTHIDPDSIFMFNAQGEIRGIFDKDGLKPDTYLQKFYPLDINADKYKRLVEKDLDNLYKALEAKFQYDVHIEELPDFTIYTENFAPMNLTFTGKKAKLNDKDIKKIVDGLDAIYKDIEGLKENKALADRDKEQLSSMQETLSLMQEKYSKKSEVIKAENTKINAFNTFMNEYKQRYDKKITDEQAVYSDYVSGKAKAIEAISNIVKEQRGLTQYQPAEIDEEIVPETNPVDKFEFVSKLQIERVDKKYVNGLIKGALKKGKSIDTLNITKAELEDFIKNNTGEYDTPIEALRSKLNNTLDKDFTPRNSIIESGMDVYQEVSSGFDAQMYFTLISGESSDKGVYIIDQPEDHISQKAIKEKVLSQFRRMGENRQVIMVTHNPQFIINLDVDNVVFLSEQDGTFDVKSGALEYEDENYSVLDIVAENVEGGLAQIQGRLKRYEKKLYTE